MIHPALVQAIEILSRAESVGELRVMCSIIKMWHNAENGIATMLCELTAGEASCTRHMRCYR